MAEVKCETVLKRFQIVSKLMADGNSGNVQMNADQTLASSVTPSIVDEEKLKQFCWYDNKIISKEGTRITYKNPELFQCLS